MYNVLLYVTIHVWATGVTKGKYCCTTTCQGYRNRPIKRTVPNKTSPKKKVE